MEQNKKIPVSGFAGEKLEKLIKNYFVVPFFIAFISFFIFLMKYGDAHKRQAPDEPLFLKTLLVIAFLAFSIAAIEYFLKRKKILAENARDYEMSLKLAVCLQKLSETKVSECDFLDPEIKGEWKPFRVEHFLSDSLRGEFSGTMKIKLYGLFVLVGGGTLEGISKGIAVPNLLDASSMLFLKDGQNNTLRVIIPSPRVAKEFLLKAIEGWLGFIPYNTHTGGVIKHLSLSDENFLQPLVHPTLIDSLDASCQTAFENRPKVAVRGEEIQPGVAFATALRVGDEEKMFFPSGFFSQLAEKVKVITGVREPGIKAIEMPKVERV